MQLNTLVIAEHKNSKLAAATLNTITAAAALGKGNLSVLVAGSGIGAISKEVQAVSGVHVVLEAEQDSLKNQLAEPLAELIVALHAKYAPPQVPAMVHDATQGSNSLQTMLLVQAEVQSHSSAIRYLWS